MALPSEYHLSVRQLILDPAVVLGLSIILAVFVSSSHAQINGAPASVTSPGFGGRPINGAPPSVSSLGPLGYGPSPRGAFAGPNVRLDGSPGRDGRNHPHRHHSVPYTPSFGYVIPVPYAVDMGPADDVGADANSDDNYQGGPTIFDRRGQGAASYIPPVQDVPTPHAQAADPPATDPGPPQQPTLLVFKDGRRLEVGNYAILGQTLFDLTPGHARKIALADLDLEATLQQNEERGITFQLPPSSQAN